jgi:DNA-binding transcriptional LysR family regulator
MRQAADAMAVTHSVVSRHIRNLELWLGVDLFTGNRRATVLTPEGRRYFIAVSEGLDRIASATENIRPLTPWQNLNIWCVPGLASRWLVPKLDEVRELIPDVEITIRPTLDVPDLAKGEVDLLITYDPVNAEGWWQTELMSPRVIAVASPDFFEHFPGIKTPRDLLQVPLLHELSVDYWRQWLDRNGVSIVTALKGPRLWYLNNVLDAAKNGQGVALAPEIVVRDDIRAGHLREIKAETVRIGTYNLYTRKEKVISRSLAKFREWVVKEFAEFEHDSTIGRS